MKYKDGDKVVVKIDETDASGLNKGDNVAFYNSQLLGRLEDFQTDNKKIKMTPDEKEEFDKLYPDNGQDVSDIFDEINDCADDYPNLCKRLFSGSTIKNFHSQIEFVRALEKPSLIEVVREKKYYVHLFKSQDFGYLNQYWDSLRFIISDKSETGKRKTKFTRDEIENFKDLGFKINDDALEEVEDE